MAFNAANLALKGHVNGFNEYRYDTTDSHATVDVEGYINNIIHMQKIKAGDIFLVVVWDTIRTGEAQTFGWHIVRAVSATGDVDLTDVTAGTVTDSR